MQTWGQKNQESLVETQGDLEKKSTMALRDVTWKKGVVDPWSPFWCAQIPLPFVISAPGFHVLCFSKAPP